MKKVEHKLQSQIMLEFGNLSWIRIWRANTGVAVGGDGRVVRFGLLGQADISGIISPHGRRLEIEVKTPTGRQSKPQRAFQATIESLGGLYILARSLDDVHAAFEREGYYDEIQRD